MKKYLSLKKLNQLQLIKNKNLKLFTINNINILSHSFNGETQILKIKHNNKIHNIKLNLIGKFK